MRRNCGRMRVVVELETRFNVLCNSNVYTPRLRTRKWFNAERILPQSRKFVTGEFDERLVRLDKCYGTVSSLDCFTRRTLSESSQRSTRVTANSWSVRFAPVPFVCSWVWKSCVKGITPALLIGIVSSDKLYFGNI